MFQTILWPRVLSTFALPTVVLLSSTLRAEVLITMAPSDPADLSSHVQVSFSGSGTITEAGSGSALDFLNFDTGVFDALPDGNTDFIVDVVFTGTDASSLAPYTQSFQTLRLADQSSGDDVLLRDLTNASFSFDVDDTYSVSGVATLDSVPFSDLPLGLFQASLTTGDAAKFGGATLEVATVATVPEPTGLPSISVVGGGLLLHHRMRRRNRAAKSGSCPRA